MADHTLITVIYNTADSFLFSLSHLRVPTASDEATSISLGEQEWISQHVWWELDLHNIHIDESDWPYEKDYVDCNNHGTHLNCVPQVRASRLSVTGTHKPIVAC